MEKIGSRGATASTAAVNSLLLLLLLLMPLCNAGSNCTRSCGDIDIPYPFGMEPGCYHAAGFNLTCSDDQIKMLLLGDGTVQVLEIFVSDSRVRINGKRVVLSFDGLISTANGTWGGGLPRGGPYVLSESAGNSLVVVGCGVQVDLRVRELDFLLGSCTAVCPAVSSVGGSSLVLGRAGNCSGIGCCDTNIALGYSVYKLRGSQQYADNRYLSVSSSVYITDSVFSANSICRDSANNPDNPHPFRGYVCSCSDGYQGNPYIIGGCQDIDECGSQINPLCYGECKNTVGSYICRCPSGYTGNASIPNGCKGLSIGLGVGGGISILLLALGGPYIMRKVKLQKVKKEKQKNFKQNHGLLLQQLIAHNTDIGERMIITLRDIEKATDNFDRARVIGGGGHGVVFKGILDLHVVAIKKSKIVVQREISEFINEVAILSKVNHRNVVKLLGCCLEAEVPLLVYEFISNGTLCHHLHVEGPISLSWDNRMRIATEVAKALSYLHSSASMPIFHRDIKSSNILLDNALTAKVSDFGASRYIPIDQKGVTTAVQGTMGYLDPMYYYTGRLTDKSDVFSFGVLLVELLTRKKPYVYRSVDDDGLVSHFVSLLTEGKLVDIVDPQVMEEEDGEIQEVATLAAMCTKLKGEDRPTMREVEMALESLLVKKRHVPYNGTLTRNERDETTANYMSTNQGTEHASRQYTMEEEMLLSASYPR
ncbi:unnamed protein product [Urochloa decumbens]|uniref:Protein kinase domain-containing protein n=1 Tax=Urochloa decumbens TaxID=240449 RepID=A0ABC9ANW8_9POAL